MFVDPDELSVTLTGGSNSWANNFAKLDGVKNSTTATVYIDGDAMNYITSGAQVVSGKGTVGKTSGGIYDFMLMVGYNQLILIRMREPSASSLGTIAITTVK